MSRHCYSDVTITSYQLVVRSFNQPKLFSNASWNPNAISFADNNTVGNLPYTLFINTNNTIFMARYYGGQILMWLNASVTPTTIIANLSSPSSLFVTGDDQILVYSDYPDYHVGRWLLNGTRLSPLMSGCSQCSGLFVDAINNLYCSQAGRNQVVKTSLQSPTTDLAIVAGTGCQGSAANMLNSPTGIFVTLNLDLYVADCLNERVQLFRSGQMNGTTVVLNGPAGIITLFLPRGITMDGDGYLFIVDSGNNRIIGSGPGGFRCVVGCSGSASSASSNLYNPWTMSFDRDGNIFVADTYNNRIQKFMLSQNSSDSTTVTPMVSTQSQTGLYRTIFAIILEENKRISSDIPTSTAMISTPQASILNQSCFAPLVTLIPSTSNLSFLMQFRRNQDISLSSSMEVNCNNSLSIQFNWLINNCSTSSCVNTFAVDSTLISTTGSELYIPALTLPFGIFELQLIVTMTVASSVRITKSVFVSITPAGVTANLVALGTSMITRGSGQDLPLNPGLYSVDLDEDQFNASDWNYQYFCRIDGASSFPSIQGIPIPIDDSRLNLLNSSCLHNCSGNGSSSSPAWRYEGVSQSLKSSLLILGGSLQSNRTYQWMVQMENKRNQSRQGTGYLLVHVEETFSQIIAIGCVISTLCVPNLEYQWIDPTTQVALFALCLDNCSSQAKNITWNIYQGSINASQNLTQWLPFNSTSTLFFGANTENFIVTNELFLSNPSITLWRFEVVYSFATEASSSSLNFVINQPPRNGSCSISPENGTTTTPFTVSCPDWLDEDGIKDYSLYIWSADPSTRTLIAFSPDSIFEVYLPAGVDPTYSLQLVISIRDWRDCVTEWPNITSISVRTDSSAFDSLLQNISGGSTTNPFVRLLTIGNQNQVAQAISSVSQQLNQLDQDNLLTATSSGVPAASIAVSSLGSSPASPSPLNLSALTEFERELNVQASLREYLCGFLVNLPINTLRTIQIQSTSLAHLTQSTGQLTRTVLNMASDRCVRLASALQSMAQRVSREEVQLTVIQLLQSATNLLTAVNGPLGERMKVLETDLAVASRFPVDYQTDLESDWAHLNLFDDGEDVDQRRNVYYQTQLSTRVSKQMNEMMDLLTRALNIQLNVEQQFTMNTPSVFMSMETVKVESLLGKDIPSVDNARLRLPSIWNLSLGDQRTGSLRSTLEPLPSFGSSLTTNLSRSMSLTFLDREGNDIPLLTGLDHPFEIIIPRDSSLIIPPMSLQNVTGQHGFHFHSVDLSPMSSIHLEMHPLDLNLSYAFIYRFDRGPVLNTSQSLVDGWTIFSPPSNKHLSSNNCSLLHFLFFSNLTNESVFTYFLDNEQTLNHRSLIFGLRQLNDSSPLINERVMFTSNYELRLYTSACFYFDEETQQWKSDGMKVGPLTNHFYTQCFSTHI